jgi:GH24 family phage-related lysozyme (muramidase)
MEDHGIIGDVKKIIGDSISDAEQLRAAVESKTLKAFFAARGFVHPHVNEGELQAIISIVCMIGTGVAEACGVVQKPAARRT